MGETAPGAGAGAREGGVIASVAARDLVHEIFEHDVLPTLAAYTEIRCLSPAFDPAWRERGEIARAAETLRGWCASRPVPGVTAEVVELDGRTPVLLVDVAATDPTRAGSTTLVYGHLDKQPPLGAWRDGLDPFRAVREGDRLYGRGTADDGYATFSALAALEACAASGRTHGRVVLLVEASEESGSPDLDAYLDALAPRIGTPSLVVCLDSGCVTYDSLWVTTSLRGNLVVTLRVDVLGEGVHSGVAGGIVPSSARLVRQLVGRLEDVETGDLLLPELGVDIPPHRRREIAEVALEHGDAAAGSFPTVAGLRLAGADAAERVERGTWRASLALTGADGIPATLDGGNVLRPYTAVKLSIRLPPTCDAELARQAIETELLRDPPHGARVRLDWEQPATGWDAPAPAAWLEAALQVGSLAYFGKPPRRMGLGGSIPFMAALGARYPQLTGPSASDICYATHNRQEALAAIAPRCDLVLVVGSTTSSNSRRLVEVAERLGVPAHLVDDDTDIDLEWLDGASTIGITAGASAPESVVTRVVRALEGLGPIDVSTEDVRRESVTFPLPLEVR
jgi:acetylornithine deacetylase/succinyl-diaminopimelate desuccinylase-like protein